MNLFTGAESTELFGGEVPPGVRRLVDQVRGLPRQDMAAVLWTATVSTPDSLPLYYLLYKLHASLGELDPALKAAQRGLAQAARCAGIAPQWQQVRPGDVDFCAPGPARFWLFTLKALAFIHTRRGERETARALIAQLRRLDPADQLGIGVVAALTQAGDRTQTP